ncbi:MAG: VWA domain-containing protein [Acidobacteria bacterium]|nr:VWA domain-containing protein [Acidobacteriota bacterium]
MSIRVALVSAAVTAISAALAAQTPAPQKTADPQRPVFRTEANFVRVDIFPTRGGVPVADLSGADFELLEDGVPQKIETVEFVRVRAGLADERREPNTISQSREAMKDPRARVFVLFLDVPHVTMGGAWNVREPLVRLLDRILAPDDLIGVMTPMMAASDIVFARKTDVVAGGLRDRWPWGERFTLQRDEREYLYEACYPFPETRDVVAEMIARRRERATLESMHELVSWLRTAREERKAILTVSEGWALFGRNADLTRPRTLSTGGTEPIPGPQPIGTGPDGRIRIGHIDGYDTGSKTECDRDRQHLSQIDNERYFRDIMDEANRGNSSFYTVDPRGLPVFDTPIGPAVPPPPSVDQRMLTHRIGTLRTLAENTDGLAVVNSNDIEKGLRKMADDLNSYYLIGYYSTNTKLDGRFRQIKVRVTQPGIDVRARRGYKAATAREMTAAVMAAPPPVPDHVAAARNALAGLARLRPSAPFRARAIMAQGEAAAIWVSGEVSTPSPEARSAEVTVSTSGGTVSATAPLAAGQRAFLIPVALTGQIGEPVDVRVRIAERPGQPPLTEMIRLEVGPGLSQPLLYRRGPVTGNRIEPTGEPSFSRTERARFELPESGDVKPTGGRILDRNGAAVAVPVTLSARTDGGGLRWIIADVTLAALAAGDYILELSSATAGTGQTILTAFRVTR